MFVSKKKYNKLKYSFDILTDEYVERNKQMILLNEQLEKYKHLLVDIKVILDYYKDPVNKCKKDRFIKTIENKYTTNGIQ